MTAWPLAPLACVLTLALPATLTAQTAQSPPPARSAAAQPADQTLKAEELEALVAQVALYPDNLLSLVLMASTYPLEVVQADRWVKANRSLKGDALKAAADKQPWDETVKALVATPEVLALMSTKLDWTQKLGDAVLAQEADVMDAIQRLRSKAHANKKLTTTKQQKVTVSPVENRQVISIESTDPNTVYVPYYDPAVVYGGWPYPAYPPYAWPAPGYIAGGLIAAGLAFGAGYALGRWASGGNWWGGSVNWGNRNLVVNRPVNINNIGNNAGNRFQHRVDHRHGVRYSNANVAQRFGGNNALRTNAGQRMDFRGRDGGQVLRPEGGRGNVGDRGNLGDRGGAGNRVSQRPAGGDRPGAGQRPSAGQRPAQRPSGGARPGGGARDGAFNHISSGRVANRQGSRGHASIGPGGGAGRFAGGGGQFRGGGGLSAGGGFRGGSGGGFRGASGGGFRGGGGGARGGGGRRSDMRLKQDIRLLEHLDNGLGLYRFRYVGGTTAYVGVMAQEVRTVAPHAVSTGRDGYLRVHYDRIGVRFQTYDRWLASDLRR